MFENVHDNSVHNRKKLEVSKCPRVGEPVSALGHIHTMDDHRTVRRKKPEPHATIRMCLKDVISNRRSELPKTIHSKRPCLKTQQQALLRDILLLISIGGKTMFKCKGGYLGKGSLEGGIQDIELPPVLLVMRSDL